MRLQKRRSEEVLVTVRRPPGRDFAWPRGSRSEDKRSVEHSQVTLRGVVVEMAPHVGTGRQSVQLGTSASALDRRQKQVMLAGVGKPAREPIELVSEMGLAGAE